MKTTAKADSPMTQLYYFVAAQFGGLPEGKLIDVRKVGIGPKDYEKLERATKRWIKALKPHMNAKMIAQAYSWHNLDVGPKALKDGYKNGYAYVASPLFVDKEIRL